MSTKRKFFYVMLAIFAFHGTLYAVVTRWPQKLELSRETYSFEQVKSAYQVITKQLKADIESPSNKPSLEIVDRLHKPFFELVNEGIELQKLEPGSYSKQSEERMKQIVSELVDMTNELEVICGMLFEDGVNYPMAIENVFELNEFLQTPVGPHIKIGLKLQGLTVLGRLAKANPSFGQQFKQLFAESDPVFTRLWKLNEIHSMLKTFENFQHQSAQERWRKGEKITASLLEEVKPIAIHKVLDTYAYYDKREKK